jgi:hypothetical protein
MGCLPHLATQRSGRYCDGVKTNEFGLYIGGKEMVTAKPSWRFKASHGKPRATVRRGPTRRKTSAAAEWSDYRETSTRGFAMECSPHRRCSVNAAKLVHVSAMQARSHLTPTARSAMAAHMRQTHLVVNSRPGSVGKILCRRYVHSWRDARHYRDSSRCPLLLYAFRLFYPRAIECG